MANSPRNEISANSSVSEVRIALRGRVWWATFQVGHEQQRRSLKTKSKKRRSAKLSKSTASWPRVHTFRHSFISHALTLYARGGRAELGRARGCRVLKLYTHIANAASKAAMQRLAEETTMRSRREKAKWRERRPRKTARWSFSTISTQRPGDEQWRNANKSRRPLRATAQYISGGHGIRTHNPLRGT